MGLLQAGVGALTGVLADQWREYFYCEALSEDVLATKGVKRTSGRSSNTRGEDNIISNGAIIAVNDGQCMMIVEQGAIVEFCAQPGEFVWDKSTEPTIFYGGLGQGLKGAWETLKKRFTLGGDTGMDQRIYYFNTKEIIGNKYGTPNAVPFRVVDRNIGLDVDIAIRCFGEYSYKMTNPMLFYKNVCGNVTENYIRAQIDSQLKAELLTALQPAFAKISAMGVRYSELPGHADTLSVALNDVLSLKWGELRGVEVVSFGVSSVKASEEDEAMIKEMQKAAVYRDPTMAGAALVGAQADALRAAAANEGAGAFMAFAGMNMAQQAGGNAQGFYNMQQPQPPQPPQQPQSPAAGAAVAAGWTCACGAKNTGKFCAECGKPQPVGWTCACGAVNKGKFCAECGKPKPAAAPLYRCDKCGWEPKDPKNPPRFCPECGDPFNEGDIK